MQQSHSLMHFLFGPDGKIVMGLNDYQHNHRSLFLSSDDGTTWSNLFGGDSLQYLLGTGKPDEFFVCVGDVNRNHSSTLRTTNDGASWDDVTAAAGSSVYSISWQGGNSYLAAGSRIYSTSDGWATHSEMSAGVFQQISALRNGNFLIRNNNSAQIGNFTSGTGWIDMPQTFQAQNVGYVGANRLVGITSIDFASDSLLGDSHLYGGGSYPLIYLYNSDSNKMLPVPTMPTPEYHYPWVMPINGMLSLLAGDSTGTILYSTGDGLYKTTDDGAHWQELPIQLDNPTQIQIDRQGRIYTKRLDPKADVDMSWIHMSENGGRTWTRMGPCHHGFYGILGQGYDGGIITSAGVWSTTTCSDQFLFYYGGIEMAQWTTLASTLKYQPGTAIVTDSADNVLFVDGFLANSDDKGISWNALPDPPVAPIAFAYSPHWNMYIADSNVLYKSIDDGATWQKIKIGIRELQISSVYVPKEGSLYITTLRKGVYHSTDDGATWNKLVGPWGDSVLCIGTTDDGTLYLGTASEGLFSAQANGMNPVAEPLQLSVMNRVNAIYVKKGKEVYVAAQGSPLWWMQGTQASVSSPQTSSAFELTVVDGNVLRIISPENASAHVELFNTIGIRLQHNDTHVLTDGVNRIPLDLTALPVGVYWARITVGNETKVVMLNR